MYLKDKIIKMKVEEFGNNFYDESSEKILGEKKFP